MRYRCNFHGLLSCCCVDEQGVTLVAREWCFGVMKTTMRGHCYSEDMSFKVYYLLECIVYMSAFRREKSRGTCYIEINHYEYSIVPQCIAGNHSLGMYQC